MAPQAPPLLYYMAASPPCRSVLLLARALGLRIVLRELNVLAGEQLDAAFIKLNPQHTVPTLDDNGFILWESGAILCYLTDQYAKDDSLYPRDPKRRAVVDQLLYFDSATLQQRINQYFRPVAFSGANPDPSSLQKVEEALGYLDKFIEGRAWTAGDYCTLADFSLAVSVSNAEAFGVNINKYPQIRKWYTRSKQEMLGFEELNQAGANMLASILKQKAQENEGDKEHT
ncbi:glutathione S-transferase D7-like [Schistocerca gregaria]|uniref:glutathione S-transferase D7-like n=1 Tax=Schistocerca gregaria TaxID=7010 RepID=UPI00211E7A6F|nr:glutathione S-transferase D7-like [Schistocerca gregaria]